MLRGGTIVIVAICSKFFLGMQLKLHNFLGCVGAIVGIAIVGVSNFVFKQTDSGGD